jgi:hypothetical protein
MSKLLAPIAQRDSLLQFALPGTTSDALFYEPLTQRVITDEHAFNIAMKANPVLFRRRHIQERASALLLTRFEKMTFLDTIAGHYGGSPELVAQLIATMDTRFGYSRAMHSPKEVNDFF